MSCRFPSAILIAALTITIVPGARAASTPFLGRGANISASDPESTFASFAAAGGHLVRLSFATRPLRNLTPPYAFNQQNLALLDHDLDICQKYGLHVVVDPHVLPGMDSSHFTMSPKDSFWGDPKFMAMAVQLWTQIAGRLADRGSVVAAYDLMNEPALPDMGRKGSGADWNAMAAQLIRAVRAKDPNRPVIIEAPVIFAGANRFVADRAAAFATYLAGPPARNVIYSLHMYTPQAFTFEGLNSGDLGLKFPGMINEQLWDAARIAEFFQPVANFQREYHVQIYLGEFSAVRWSGDSGNTYLRDVIEYAEAHGWSWTYQEWRGADPWDAEKSNFNRADHKRYATTPRLQMLTSYWKRGDKQF